jgi:hypothetical protein
MARVLVRSRSGNVVLAVLGAVYTVAALVASFALARDVWNATGVKELALQMVLIGSAACGLWFLVSGLENLGLHVMPKGLPHFLHRHSGSH